MRIPVVDFYPHISGPSTYARNVQRGLSELGHDSPLVTFTKSGKDHVSWTAPNTYKYGCRASHVRPDIVIKNKDAIEFLQTCDAVVLAEPRSTVLDGEAAREGVKPPYIYWLAKSGTPWTTFLPCPQFGPKFAPYLRELVEKTVCPGIIAAYPSFVPLALKNKGGDLTIVWDNKLPFQPVKELRDPVPERRGLGVYGRLQSNKGGWSSLFAVLPSLNVRWPIEIYGACARSNATTNSVLMIETLRAEYGQEALLWLNPENMNGNTWQPIYPDTFKMQTKTGHVIAYMGGYTEFPAYVGTQGLNVCVNLSSASFTTGTIENVGLEALDSGCLLVTGPHLIANDHDKYMAIIVEDHWENATHQKSQFLLDEAPAANLVGAVYAAMEMPYEDHYAIAVQNRMALRTHHAPARHAALLLAALTGDSPNYAGCNDVTIDSAADIDKIIADDLIGERSWSRPPAQSLPASEA